MFEILRKAIIPIMGTVLVLFVLTIFWNWGYGGGKRAGEARATVAGTINGVDVSWRDWQTAYNDLYQAESQKQDAEIPDARVKELEQQAWDQLVADVLLNQEADKRKVSVTDEDLYTYLRLSPPPILQRAEAFQTNGQFDYNKYLAAMANEQMAPAWASIENMIRPDLRKFKLRDLILRTVQVSEPEVKDAFLESNEMVKVGALNVRTKLFESRVPVTTPEEARTYFNEHRDDYKVDERVVLSLVKVPVLPSAADTAAARNTAVTVYDSVIAGTDFATLAQNWSQDPGSAGKGGDLGWIEQGRTVHEFDSASFVMKEGEISTPIKTRFGFHIIKHLGYKTEDADATSGGTGKVLKAHISHILIPIQVSPETKSQAYNKLTDILANIGGDGTKLTEAAAEQGLQIVTTQPTTRNQRIMEAAGDTRISDWAFTHSAGDVSDILEIRDAYLVARLDQKLPAGLAEFESVEKQIGDKLRKEKMAKLCHDTAAVIYTRVQGGLPLNQAAEQLGGEYEQYGPMSRASRLIQFDRDPAVAGTAFSLTSIGQVSKPADYSGGSVILQLLERTTPDLTTFTQKRDSVYNAVLNQKRQQVYGKWYQDLLSTADIKSNVGWRSAAESE